MTSQHQHPRLSLAGLVLITLTLWTNSAGSAVQVTSMSSTQELGTAMIRIAIRETIAMNDLESFKAIARTFDATYKKWSAVIDLNSRGGSVQVALAIGEIVRERGFAAQVDRDASCMSACVYILAGASTRIVNQFATIGIHRPYDPDDKIETAEQQRVKQTELGKRIIGYLKMMAVPTRLYEDSVFISPDRMKILTSVEISGYGLDANDPSVEEADQVRQAKSLGISRAELGKRKAEARRRCGLDRMNDDTPSPELRKALLCMAKYVQGQ